MMSFTILNEFIDTVELDLAMSTVAVAGFSVPTLLDEGEPKGSALM
jgi:hypothetical protein